MQHCNYYNDNERKKLNPLEYLLSFFYVTMATCIFCCILELSHPSMKKIQILFKLTVICYLGFPEYVCYMSNTKK